MEWTAEEKLKIIAATVAVGPINETYRLLLHRILMICISTPKFLELNKRNFKEAIEFLEKDGDIAEEFHKNYPIHI